jgi:predicted MPP superfamily phosphohydrolase
MLGAQSSGVLILALLYNLPPGMLPAFVLYLVHVDVQGRGRGFAFWHWLPYFASALGYAAGGFVLAIYLWRRHAAWISETAKRFIVLVAMSPVALLTLLAVLTMKPPGPLVSFLFVCPLVTGLSMGWIGPCVLYGWWIDHGVLQRFLSVHVNAFDVPVKTRLGRVVVAVTFLLAAVLLLRTDITEDYPHVRNGVFYSLGITLIAMAVLQIWHIWGEALALPQAWGTLSELDIPPISDEPIAICVTHWSDLHLTKAENYPRISKTGLGGNLMLARMIREHETQLRKTDLLLLTGDMTDAGTGEEWRAFQDLMPSWLLEKTVMLPGNHDVNVTDAAHLRYVETGEMVARRLRLIRSMAALDMVQGTRAYICSKDGQLFNLREYLSRWGDQLQRYTANPLGLVGPRPQYPGWRAFVQLSELRRIAEVDVEGVWRYMFPMMVEVPNTQIKLLLLDTNELGYSILDNAFGRISDNALMRFEKLLERFSNQPIVIGLHHHLALPKFSLKPLTALQIKLMMLRNAPSLLRLFASDRNFVVFHGHLHIGYRRVINNHIQVVSAPSTTLGDERLGTSPSFTEYEIGVWQGREGPAIRSCRDFLCS